MSISHINTRQLMFVTSMKFGYPAMVDMSKCVFALTPLHHYSRKNKNVNVISNQHNLAKKASSFCAGYWFSS